MAPKQVGKQMPLLKEYLGCQKANAIRSAVVHALTSLIINGRQLDEGMEDNRDKVWPPCGCAAQKTAWDAAATLNRVSPNA